ncbi:hypothetical protein JTE90_008362, partial [Oedothorax gibbosus]
PKKPHPPEEPPQTPFPPPSVKHPRGVFPNQWSSSRPSGEAGGHAQEWSKKGPGLTHNPPRGVAAPGTHKGLRGDFQYDRIDKRITRMLAEKPNMDYAGSNVNLVITSSNMTLSVMESGE